MEMEDVSPDYVDLHENHADEILTSERILTLLSKIERGLSIESTDKINVNTVIIHPNELHILNIIDQQGHLSPKIITIEKPEQSSLYLKNILRDYGSSLTNEEKKFITELSTILEKINENSDAIGNFLRKKKNQLILQGLYEKHEKLMNFSIPHSIKRYLNITTKISAKGVIPLTPGECVQLGLKEKLTERF